MKVVLRLGCISVLFFGTCAGFAGSLTSMPIIENVQAAGQRWPVGDTVDVCAIRIEFVPDSIDGTLGDGTMGSAFSDSLIIDPLPHDKAYFEDHLAFLEHYYGVVSKGCVRVSKHAVSEYAADLMARKEQAVKDFQKKETENLAQFGGLSRIRALEKKYLPREAVRNKYKDTVGL